MSKFRDAVFSLNRWFLHSQRILPWRDQPQTYSVWISEIMLQQTQVVTVVPYFQRFIQRFPDVQTLATASEDEVLKYWAGLGYYSRARNIHRAARKIWFELGGEFPRTREGWVAIPGVGPYTAGAILSIALNHPEAILDGNVERVLSRLRTVSRSKGDTVFKSRLWKLSGIFVNTAAHRLGVEPRVLNQALMELGARICTPKNPKCEECPMSGLCRARQSGQQLQYPPRKAPKTWVKVEERVVCLLDARGRVLVERRQDRKWRQGLWDLPEALPASKLRGYQPQGEVEVKYVVTRHKVSRKADVFVNTSKNWKAAEPEIGEGYEMRWISVSDPEVPVGASFKKTCRKITESRF